MDDQYIKAYLLNGECLVELGKLAQNGTGVQQIDKGILRMKKALHLCFNLNQRQFESEINSQILKAQKIKWYKEKEHDHTEKSTFLSDLKHRFGHKEHDILERFENFIIKSDETINPAHKENHKKFGNREIPEFLLCRITDDLM